jgi:enediyne core biosynthesis thioesterase
MHIYEYRHCVGFEDTNVVGNVYYANYIRWQGRCREMFLREHAPQLVQQMSHGLTMATTRVSCSYYEELAVFDEVAIRMTKGSMSPSRLTMKFQYYKVLPGGFETLIAEGEQEVVCVKRQGSVVELVPLPESLRDAVAPYEQSLGSRKEQGAISV